MFRTVAALVAVIGIGNLFCKAGTEQTPKASSEDEIYGDTPAAELHQETASEILWKTVVCMAASFIVVSVCHLPHPEKRKSFKAKIETAPQRQSITHYLDNVAAETQPRNVKNNSFQPHGGVAYTPETKAIASLALKGNLSELLQALDIAYGKVGRRMPRPSKALLESSATLHVTSAVQACVSQRLLGQAVIVFDHCHHRIGSANTKLWRLLVYAASHSEEHIHRAAYFFEQSMAHGKVSSTDVVNVTAFYATTQDLPGFRAMLREYVDKTGLLDNMSRNRAMTVCAKAGADKLLMELASDQWSQARDVVTYNLLMKYYVKKHNTAACLQTFCEMREANVKPSEVSIGIILDSCSQQSGQNNADLQHVCDLLVKSDLPMNRVNYTTYIKVLLQAGRFDKAAEVLEHMRKTPELSPDLVTYSTMVKGFANKGDVAGGLKWLEQMISDGVSADNAVFNYLLKGCSMQAYDTLFVDGLLSKFMSLGFKPCTGSISVLLKVFAKSSSWSKAFELLQSAGSRFGIAPEQRIYKQLALACHKAGQSHWVHRTYKAMEEDLALRGERIDGSIHRLMRSYCKQNCSVKLKCESSLSD